VKSESVSCIQIADKTIGLDCPSFVIAEIAQAHDGSLGMAHAYIDAVAKVGADAVKFQTHIAKEESTPQEQFRTNVFPQDATRYDYWKRMEFTFEQWVGLALHAKEKGLIFLSSPFSLRAVELLDQLDVPAWKIGSGEIGNLPILEHVALTGKPVLLSSGMSDWIELDAAVTCVRAQGADVALFQCTTSYPCPPEELGLNVLDELKQRYGCPVGLSDHSGTIFAALGAVTLGANLIEVHTVFSHECFGPDVNSSVTITELAQIIEGVRFIERAMAHPVQKDDAALVRSDLRLLFGKSLLAAHGLPAGHQLVATDIAIKKPGSGIPAKCFTDVVGRILKRDYKANQFFKEQDFE